MEIKDIYKKLENQCPSNYRINEVIPITYPYRRIRINATVNKSPEESIKQVYAVFIRAIKSGLTTEIELTRFLGLDKDDFILRELYFLRERGYLDLISGKWMVTALGENFIKDNSILKILSEELFEFYIDAYNYEIVPCDYKSYSTDLSKKKLEPKINLGIKSPELLIGKTEQIADIYKKSTEGKAYLIDYNVDDILFDKKEYIDYYLIEYVPNRENENEVEPRIEIRNSDKDYSLNKRLTKILSEEYPTLVYQIT